MTSWGLDHLAEPIAQLGRTAWSHSLGHPRPADHLRSELFVGRAEVHVQEAVGQGLHVRGLGRVGRPAVAAFGVLVEQDLPTDEADSRLDTTTIRSWPLHLRSLALFRHNDLPSPLPRASPAACHSRKPLLPPNAPPCEISN